MENFKVITHQELKKKKMDWAQVGYDFEGNQAKEMKQKWGK